MGPHASPSHRIILLTAVCAIATAVVLLRARIVRTGDVEFSLLHDSETHVSVRRAETPSPSTSGSASAGAVPGPQSAVTQPTVATPAATSPSAAATRRTWVVFSTDNFYTKYLASAPLSAYLWSHHLNVTPLVYLYAIDQADPRARIIRDFIVEGGGIVEPIVPREYTRGDLRATTTQVVRLAAVLHADFHPDDLFTIADSDVWPLSRAFWTGVLSRKNYTRRLWMYHGPFWYAKRAQNSDNFAMMHYPIATVGRWREIYATWCAAHNLTALPPGSVLSALRQLLDAGAAYLGPTWYDQTDGSPMHNIQVGARSA